VSRTPQRLPDVSRNASTCPGRLNSVITVLGTVTHDLRCLYRTDRPIFDQRERGRLLCAIVASLMDWGRPKLTQGPDPTTSRSLIRALLQRT
jgi:hypothetical protein